MNIKHKILLVDHYNVALRGMHVHKDMQYHGEQTGGLYGFCNILFSNIVKHQPTEIFFVKDGKKTQRSNPNALELAYKANRKQSIDKTYFNTSLSLIDEFIAKSSIGGVLQQNDVEADYIISTTCEYLTSPIVILSNDSDLFGNLMFKNVVIQTHKTTMTASRYVETYGILPVHHTAYLALCGGHNNLPHPKGMGPKKALALIKKGMDYGDVFYTISKTLSSSDYDVFCKVHDRITRTWGKRTWGNPPVSILMPTNIPPPAFKPDLNRVEAEDFLISKGVRLANTKKAFDTLQANKMVAILEGDIWSLNVT
jgi:5'-3' exonuclease